MKVMVDWISILKKVLNIMIYQLTLTKDEENL